MRFCIPSLTLRPSAAAAAASAAAAALLRSRHIHALLGPCAAPLLDGGCTRTAARYGWEQNQQNSTVRHAAHASIIFCRSRGRSDIGTGLCLSVSVSVSLCLSLSLSLCLSVSVSVSISVSVSLSLSLSLSQEERTRRLGGEKGLCRASLATEQDRRDSAGLR